MSHLDLIETAEGYVLLSEAGRYLLYRLASNGSLTGSEMEELFGGWEDWRFVIHLVVAGYAIDGTRGLMVTKKALDAVERLFDKPD